jgi:hypothetical protein
MQLITVIISPPFVFRREPIVSTNNNRIFDYVVKMALAK